jgi:glycerophosphoryl diester phosphodiesterase
MMRASLLLVAACGAAHPAQTPGIPGTSGTTGTPGTPGPPGTARYDREGHRGARGLAPENTLDAFSRALDLGVDTLEMDTMLTADNALVVHHDEHLNPDITRDASGAYLTTTGPAVRALQFSELETYDVGRIRPGTVYAARFPDQRGRDGVRIPTLDQVIELAERRSGKRIRYNLEIKTTPGKPNDTAPPEQVADALVATVRKWGIGSRVTIQSFDIRGLRRVAEIAPELPRSCLTDAPNIAAGVWMQADVAAFGGSVPKLVRAAGCTIWSPDEKTLTEPQVAEAHALGLRVLPWTVNEPDAIARIVGWGVDGVISDFPDRLH